MNANDAAADIRSAIRDRLRQLAADLGDHARLSQIRDGDSDASMWRLQPVYPNAAAIAWDATRTDDWAAYLTLGIGTKVRVLTSPEGPADAAVETVAAHLDRVVAGDFREELWRSQWTGQPVAAIGWIREHQDAPWPPVGNRTRPLPVIRHLIYDHDIRHYAAYDPPQWERLLDALHDRAGTYFDADEVHRAREWLQTSEGARLTRQYRDADPGSARERELRAQIEAVIRS